MRNIEEDLKKIIENSLKKEEADQDTLVNNITEYIKKHFKERQQTIGVVGHVGAGLTLQVMESLKKQNLDVVVISDDNTKQSPDFKDLMRKIEPIQLTTLEDNMTDNSRRSRRKKDRRK